MRPPFMRPPRPACVDKEERMRMDACRKQRQCSYINQVNDDVNMISDTSVHLPKESFTPKDAQREQTVETPVCP